MTQKKKAVKKRKASELTTAFGTPVADDQNSLTAGEPPFDLSGKAGRYPFTFPNDDFVQPGTLYRKVMTDEARDHLVGNIVDHLGRAQKRIQMRQTALFYKADENYGTRVAKGLGLDINEIKRLANMSQEDRAKATAEDR